LKLYHKLLKFNHEPTELKLLYEHKARLSNRKKPNKTNHSNKNNKNNKPFNAKLAKELTH
jgi:hypothetical protein